MKNLSLIIAMMLTIATQAWAECGNLCRKGWWATATKADVQAEFNGGADVMARNEDGETPLHLAAAYSTSKNIQALLSAGADVTARTEEGRTPLHGAAQLGTSASVQVLIDAGTDAKAKDKYDITPWDLAQRNGKLKGTKGYWALNDAQYN